MSDQEETDHPSAPTRPQVCLLFSLPPLHPPRLLSLTVCLSLGLPASPSACVGHPLSLSPHLCVSPRAYDPSSLPHPHLAQNRTLGAQRPEYLSSFSQQLPTAWSPSWLCLPPPHHHHHVLCPESLSHVPHCFPGLSPPPPLGSLPAPQCGSP